MPLYEFEHPETKQRLLVIQKMNDSHEYTDERGVKWNRVFGVPNARIDAEGDPFSERTFLEKTKNFKGTMGDLYDMSRELSEKRAQKRGGKDPIKDKAVKAYEKKTQKPHPLATKKSKKIEI
jgi:hypothetical protein